MSIIKFNSPLGKKIILKSFLSPGDIVMLTAAVRDLKKAYGDQILIDVRTSCSHLWENNPHLTPLDENDPYVETIDAQYPLIHKSNTSPYHFIHGYRLFLEDRLGLSIPATDFKGDIHLSDREKSWISQIEEMGVKDDFWIVNCGGKYDYTAKIINPDKIQEVINHFKGRITFVQCLDSHSRILTSRGNLKIKDIIYGDQISTEFGFSKCDGAIRRGDLEAVQITTSAGNSNISTLDHRFMSIDNESQLTWKMASDIKVGDYLLNKIGNDSLLPLDRGGDPNFWYCIGHLIGDGFLHKPSDGIIYPVWIFSEPELELMKKVETYLKLKNIKYTVEKRSIDDQKKYTYMNVNKNIYRITALTDYFNKYLPPYQSKGKWRSAGFPDYYWKLGLLQMSSLLDGLFSTDGTISINNNGYGRISFCSIYENLSRDVQHMLFLLGVMCKFFHTRQETTLGIVDTYKVHTIGRSGFLSFNNIIGFSCRSKHDRLKQALLNCKNKYSGDKKFNHPYAQKIIKTLLSEVSFSNLDINFRKFINGYINGWRKNLTRDTIAKILDYCNKNSISNKITKYLHLYIKNNWYFVQVVAKENVGKREMYDISNSQTESYISYGFVSHNCGEKKHFHIPLEGVIDLIGKTDLRQLVRLIYHSIGVMCPVTAMMHLAAAIETKKKPPINRPAIIWAGNREPPQWEQYPHHLYLHNGPALNCSDNGGCWKSRCMKVNDGDKKDNELCLFPVEVNSRLVKQYYPQFNYCEPRCLNMITANRIIEAIELLYSGNILKYNK